MSNDNQSAAGRMNSPHRLRLGLFGMNCSSGRAPIQGPHLWSGSWEDNLRVGRLADEAGLDFLLPVARWKGYGGVTDYQGATLETITWAGGLLASTRRINVFATVHVPLIHPVLAAKQFVTVDQIGRGRFGVNLVVGWNEDEFEMFGVAQRAHDARYAYAQEWLTAVRRMWGPEEDFDATGEFLNLRQVRAKPKPFGGSQPLLINATASGIGQDFAIRNCDALFTGLNALADFGKFSSHMAEVKARAAQSGRSLDVYATAIVTCRATRKEAEEFRREVVLGQADWGAVDNLMRTRNADPDRMTPEELRKARESFAGGSGGMTIVGDPDEVVAEFERLAATGLRGLALSFINFNEVDHFCAEVLPRMERQGLRVADA